MLEFCAKLEKDVAAIDGTNAGLEARGADLISRATELHARIDACCVRALQQVHAPLSYVLNRLAFTAWFQYLRHHLRDLTFTLVILQASLASTAAKTDMTKVKTCDCIRILETDCVS